MLVAFLLNSFFVFRNSTRPRARQVLDFVAINLVSFPVVWLASIELERALRTLGMVHYTEALAHAVAISLPMLATFLVYKFYAFKD
jgi:putative flippase GtrA